MKYTATDTQTRKSNTSSQGSTLTATAPITKKYIKKGDLRGRGELYGHRPLLDHQNPSCFCLCSFCSSSFRLLTVHADDLTTYFCIELE